MPKFGSTSLERLQECDPTLQLILRWAVRYYDFTIVVGHRGEADQNAAFAAGNSKLQWPDGKHNSLPSKAVDIAPYPIDWEDTERFVFLAGVIMTIAHLLGVGDKIRWGDDWDRDGRMTDERFRDYGHFEVIE